MGENVKVKHNTKSPFETGFFIFVFSDRIIYYIKYDR